MKKSLILILALFFTIFCFSCNTTKEIPSDLSSAQLLQQGQDAYASNNYDLAEKYYLETISRFGDDTLTYIEARYELGHLFLKIKDYKKAYINFNEILQIYELNVSAYPPSYKKLATKGMEAIPEEFKNQQ